MLPNKAVMAKLGKTTIWRDLLPCRMRLVEKLVLPPGVGGGLGIESIRLVWVSDWEDRLRILGTLLR